MEEIEKHFELIGRLEDKITMLEGKLENKNYLQSKDLTWKDSPMTLIEIYNIAIGTASFGEFKEFINKHYNGTPETVVDFSEYVLTKKQ